MLRTLGIILMFLCFLPARAAHLVGGEISYTCLGSNNYQIELIIYRDCQSNGAPFDNPAIITIYDGQNNFVDNLYLPLASSSLLPVTAPSSCTSLPSFVCTSKGEYTGTVNLPPNSSGYTISHQRCCRNASIDNVPNPDVWGNTYTIEIPANDNCNSSPSFRKSPPVALCLNIPTVIDMSAVESDGDSLSYSLCYPLHGGGQQTNTTGPNSPRPDTATPPPYVNVPFDAGYSYNQPFPGNPSFSLDPNTGLLSGTPSQVGQYVFAICVQEWKNGALLSTLRRDFQFNVTNACQGTASNFAPQTNDPYLLCKGTTVQFNELCFNANEFFWDFGVANSTTDTSTLPDPIFTFPDTGVYTITLIANPNSSCADTSVQDFKIYNDLDISFEIGGQACFDSHSLNFNPSGNYSDSAQFIWDFGAATNRGLGQSSEKSPQGVIYNQVGTYIVSLEVRDGECRDVFQDTVQLYQAPILRHDLSANDGCLPHKVRFKDSSDYKGGELVHYWDFGDGNTSNQASPEHVYRQAGSYFVYHEIRSVSGCIDTLFETSDRAIRVNPTPQADFTVSPPETDIYDPKFTINVKPIAPDEQSWMILPDDRRLDLNSSDFIYTAKDTGRQKFLQIIENQYGCTDSLVINTYVNQPFRLFIPNAFTPNGDNRNDLFYYSILGVSEFEIKIFNRWGEVVFHSKDPSEYWNGRLRNRGELASAGVYSYQIQVRLRESQEDFFRRGTVKLVR